jgi:hypothetical protein
MHRNIHQFARLPFVASCVPGRDFAWKAAMQVGDSALTVAVPELMRLSSFFTPYSFCEGDAETTDN